MDRKINVPRYENERYVSLDLGKGHDDLPKELVFFF